jgi:hypothetical protein
LKNLETISFSGRILLHGIRIIRNTYWIKKLSGERHIFKKLYCSLRQGNNHRFKAENYLIHTRVRMEMGDVGLPANIKNVSVFTDVKLSPFNSLLNFGATFILVRICVRKIYI